MPRIQGRRWTPDELSLLRRLANRVPLSTLVTTLDRTALAIRTKAAHERLRVFDDLRNAQPTPQQRPTSPEQAG